MHMLQIVTLRSKFQDNDTLGQSLMTIFFADRKLPHFLPDQTLPGQSLRILTHCISPVLSVLFGVDLAAGLYMSTKWWTATCRHAFTDDKGTLVQPLELGRFTHRTSDIGNNGAKRNIGESAESVCRYVIVTRWHAFNKPHSPLSISVVHGCEYLTGGRPARWNVVMQALLRWTNGLCDMTHVVQLHLA